MSASVVSLSERRYRDFEWHPDPSPRVGVDLNFGEKCALNAIEGLARVFGGHPLHQRQFTDRQGRLFWRDQ